MMQIKIQAAENGTVYNELVSTNYADATMVVAELQRMLIEAFVADVLDTTVFTISFSDDTEEPSV